MIAADEPEAGYGLLWLTMITSAANRGWQGDVIISDLRDTGLPIASVVRPAKLTTIDAREAERLGTLPAADRVAVAAYLQSRLSPVLGTN